MTKKDPFSQFFDPDVSVRIQGDRQDALGLMPQAQNLLRRATLFREAGQPVVRMWSELPDGGLLWAYLHGPVKQLYIRPGERKVAEDVRLEEEILTSSTFTPDMLNGVVVPGTGILASAEGETPTYAAHEFHPTPICAAVYSLDFGWDDNEKLGLAPDPDVVSLETSPPQMQVHYPKPSMYSGAMKRIVQAIYGISKTQDGTVFSDGTGDGGAREVVNQYDYRWERTHGIHKSGSTYWLVEISKERGVLAMPLPLFQSTTSESFLENLQEAGDTESASLVAEFGGYPNGETFPDDDELDAAIANGGVFRLLAPNDLDAFYKAPMERTVYFERHTDPVYAAVVSSEDKNGYFAACGWAFSESGAAGEAHNTCWWYSNPQIALFTDYFNDGWIKDGFNFAGPMHRYMRTEHWKVVLALPDLSGDAPTQASARLELVNEQPVEAPNHGMGSYEEQFPMDVTNSPAPEEMYGRRMYLGGTPYPPALETLMPTFRTGYHDWITGKDLYGVDELMYGFDGSVVNPTTYNIRGTGCLMASGFNPLTFEEHQTVDVSIGGGPVIDTVIFWCHSALMCVPSANSFDSRDSEKLTRFKFWGRSQANIKLSDMEPSYAAPVYVFYNGEELEIVYREAERYNIDGNGGFQAGDFWATSMDLRGALTNIPRYQNETIPTLTETVVIVFKIGLFIPAGTRESYVMMRHLYGPQDYGPAPIAAWSPPEDFYENEGTTWFHFIAGLGTRKSTLQYHYPNRPDDAPVISFSWAPGLTTNGSLLRYMWWWQWTHEIFDLGSLNNAYQQYPWHPSKSKGISWGVSMAASKIRSYYYTNDGPELGFNPWDVPWWYFWNNSGTGTYPPGFDQFPGPEPLFVYELPEKVTIEFERDQYNEYVMARPTDITFVGAV